MGEFWCKDDEKRKEEEQIVMHDWMEAETLGYSVILINGIHPLTRIGEPLRQEDNVAASAQSVISKVWIEEHITANDICVFISLRLVYEQCDLRWMRI